MSDRIYSRAGCMIVPLRVGGEPLKILDSWAMGKAVVSTPVGCEGLDIATGRIFSFVRTRVSSRAGFSPFSRIPLFGRISNRVRGTSRRSSTRGMRWRKFSLERMTASVPLRP